MSLGHLLFSVNYAFFSLFYIFFGYICYLIIMFKYVIFDLFFIHVFWFCAFWLLEILSHTYFTFKLLLEHCVCTFETVIVTLNICLFYLYLSSLKRICVPTFITIHFHFLLPVIRTPAIRIDSWCSVGHVVIMWSLLASYFLVGWRAVRWPGRLIG